MGEVTGPETHVLVGKRSFIAGYETCNEDGSINVVVEIPTGTIAKGEVQDNGRIVWEIRDGKPRFIQYLGYPGRFLETTVRWT